MWGRRATGDGTSKRSVEKNGRREGEEKEKRREEKRRKDVKLVRREKKRERVNLVVIYVKSRRGKRVKRGGFKKSGDY